MIRTPATRYTYWLLLFFVHMHKTSIRLTLGGNFHLRGVGTADNGLHLSTHEKGWFSFIFCCCVSGLAEDRLALLSRYHTWMGYGDV